VTHFAFFNIQKFLHLTRHIPSQAEDYQDYVPSMLLSTAADQDIQDCSTEINFSSGVFSHNMNWIANIRNALHLERFPFDRQIVQIPFESASQEFDFPGGYDAALGYFFVNCCL
jgi:hypothetical protein